MTDEPVIAEAVSHTRSGRDAGAESPSTVFAASSLRRLSLNEEIANQLIATILEGKLNFGDKLPTERELAAYFNVSRPSIREALRTLSVVGLIEVRHGEGAFVVDRHSDFVAQAFSWVVLLDPATTREVVEARIAIEAALTRLAAKRRTAADLEELRRHLDAMEAALAGDEPDDETFSDADLAFHITIANASSNKTLSRTLTAIRSLLHSWIENALAIEGTAADALAQHRAIYDALTIGDPQAAETEMRRHLDAMAERMTSAIRERKR